MISPDQGILTSVFKTAAAGSGAVVAGLAGIACELAQKTAPVTLGLSLVNNVMPVPVIDPSTAASVAGSSIVAFAFCRLLTTGLYDMSEEAGEIARNNIHHLFPSLRR
jgi:hypothetical protein